MIPSMHTDVFDLHSHFSRYMKLDTVDYLASIETSLRSFRRRCLYLSIVYTDSTTFLALLTASTHLTVPHKPQFSHDLVYPAEADPRGSKTLSAIHAAHPQPRNVGMSLYTNPRRRSSSRRSQGHLQTHPSFQLGLSAHILCCECKLKPRHLS